MYVPVFIPSLHSAWFDYYLSSIRIFNNMLIIAVLVVALYRIKKLIDETPQAEKSYSMMKLHTIFCVLQLLIVIASSVY